MQLIVFIIVYPIIWLLSMLPFRILYFISDSVYLLIYHVIGYRKEVVRGNIRLAYPDISEEKLKIIEKKFYHHFCDIFVEMIKTMSITAEELRKRYTFPNMEVAGQYLNNNQDIILCLGHYASYEWVLSLHIHYHNKGYGIYKRIKNKYFDKMVRDMRGKWKTELVVNKQARQKIAEVMQEQQDDAVLFGFVMDQSPSNDKGKHYSDFCNVKTPFFTGVEDLAKKYNLPVLFLGAKKVKRGYYEATFTVLAENPNDFEDYQITDMYAKALEKQIDIAPEFYFWTHKRFKFVKQITED